jgi:hypothetical protein
MEVYTQQDVTISRRMDIDDFGPTNQRRPTFGGHFSTTKCVSLIDDVVAIAVSPRYDQALGRSEHLYNNGRGA